MTCEQLSFIDSEQKYDVPPSSLRSSFASLSLLIHSVFCRFTFSSSGCGSRCWRARSMARRRASAWTSALQTGIGQQLGEAARILELGLKLGGGALGAQARVGAQPLQHDLQLLATQARDARVDGVHARLAREVLQPIEPSNQRPDTEQKAVQRMPASALACRLCCRSSSGLAAIACSV